MVLVDSSMYSQAMANNQVQANNMPNYVDMYYKSVNMAQQLQAQSAELQRMKDIESVKDFTRGLAAGSQTGDYSYARTVLTGSPILRQMYGEVSDVVPYDKFGPRELEIAGKVPSFQALLDTKQKMMNIINYQSPEFTDPASDAKYQQDFQKMLADVGANTFDDVVTNMKGLDDGISEYLKHMIMVTRPNGTKEMVNALDLASQIEASQGHPTLMSNLQKVQGAMGNAGAIAMLSAMSKQDLAKLGAGDLGTNADESVISPTTGMSATALKEANRTNARKELEALGDPNSYPGGPKAYTKALANIMVKYGINKDDAENFLASLPSEVANEFGTIKGGIKKAEKEASTSSTDQLKLNLRKQEVELKQKAYEIRLQDKNYKAAVQSGKLSNAVQANPQVDAVQFYQDVHAHALSTNKKDTEALDLDSTKVYEARSLIELGSKLPTTGDIAGIKGVVLQVARDKFNYTGNNADEALMSFKQAIARMDADTRHALFGSTVSNLEDKLSWNFLANNYTTIKGQLARARGLVDQRVAKINSRLATATPALKEYYTYRMGLTPASTSGLPASTSSLPAAGATKSFGRDGSIRIISPAKVGNQ